MIPGVRGSNGTSSPRLRPDSGLRTPDVETQARPQGIDLPLRFLVHHYLIRPGTREPFARPLAGGVDAHFGAEVGQARRMLELIDRTQHELNVALRVDVIESLPGNLAQVVYVDVVIDNHNALGEHR